MTNQSIEPFCFLTITCCSNIGYPRTAVFLCVCASLSGKWWIQSVFYPILTVSLFLSDPTVKMAFACAALLRSPYNGLLNINSRNRFSLSMFVAGNITQKKVSVSSQVVALTLANWKQQQWKRQQQQQREQQHWKWQQQQQWVRVSWWCDSHVLTPFFFSRNLFSICHRFCKSAPLPLWHEASFSLSFSLSHLKYTHNKIFSLLTCHHQIGRAIITSDMKKNCACLEEEKNNISCETERGRKKIMTTSRRMSKSRRFQYPLMMVFDISLMRTRLVFCVPKIFSAVRKKKKILFLSFHPCLVKHEVVLVHNGNACTQTKSRRPNRRRF